MAIPAIVVSLYDSSPVKGTRDTGADGCRGGRPFTPGNGKERADVSAETG